MAHGEKGSDDTPKPMCLEDWFKVRLVVGCIWASIKTWPLGIKGLWLFLLVVPLSDCMANCNAR